MYGVHPRVRAGVGAGVRIVCVCVQSVVCVCVRSVVCAGAQVSHANKEVLENDKARRSWTIYLVIIGSSRRATR